jgi:serine acetyltransferase
MSLKKGEKMKKLIRKLILGHKNCSEDFLNHHRRKGAIIGKRTVVYEPTKTFIDETRPFLIEIGDDVQITRGVTILTHGYDWSVLKGCYREVLGSAGRVKIGNNVFIGQNAMILKGVTIGNNVIIGANSLVNKDIPDNTVYAGNPARYITSIEEYYQKCKAAQISQAKCVYDNYVKAYQKDPPQEIFSEFFWLFQRRDESLIPAFEKQMKNIGNYDDSMAWFKSTKPAFDGYEDFIEKMKIS